MMPVFRSCALLIALISVTTYIQAAPKKAATKPVAQWEYAMAEESIYNARGDVDLSVKLRVGGQPTVMMRRPNGVDSDIFLLDIFNRLGAKGWELVSVPNQRGPNSYIFKRRK